MDHAALQRRLIIMLTLVGVCTLACAGAMFGGIRYNIPWLSAVGVVMLIAGFAAQIWFISAFARRPKA